jgi:hypothetical protein
MAVASTPSLAPVPWVEVETAPATVCASMSPRFGMARPRRCRSTLRTCNGVPERTVTRPVSVSARTIPVQRSRSSAVSGATAMSLNE